MQRLALLCALAAGLFVATGLFAAAKVEEQPAGPASPEATYFVSQRGGHLAIVAPKGSRTVVYYDGQAGPKFDAVMSPTFAAVDLRPFNRPFGKVGAPPTKVVFSHDGSRYAYVGRAGEEWVLMADGKEVLRMPVAGGISATGGIGGGGGNVDFRMQFTGESGKHLLMARATVNGYELYVDGQKWPGFYNSAGTGVAAQDPLVSPDGARIAYVAQIARDKATVIIDGQDAGYLADNLQWSPDGQHLIGIGHSPTGEHLLVDGKSRIKARQILGVYVAPAGDRIFPVLLHTDAKNGNGQFLLVDGKPAEATLCETIKRVIFSTDGKHYIAHCSRAGAQFLVVDGKKGQEYMLIGDSTLSNIYSDIAFSPDASKVAYTATGPAGKAFMVVGDDESDAFQGGPNFRFVADGKHIVVAGIRPDISVFMIDDKVIAKRHFNSGVAIASYTCTPDMSRQVYQAGGTEREGGMVLVDHKETGLTGLFSLSSDGKHVAVAGYRVADNKAGLYVDDTLVYATQTGLSFHSFTPDGKHLYWMGVEPSKAAGAPPGSFEFVTYLDGKPVARSERPPEAERILLPNGYIPSNKPSSAWDINPDGSLVSFTVSNDAVARVKVTPAEDTSVETLLAEAAKAPAKPRR